ncbi:DUF1697 domain-containing protein [Methylovulum miyakonense]|uniref:DUF1697 domain-containing protein n=1 Tax=Methylovulum miyakonense TaxID=645578 RepID=UPI00036FC22C|nr:DUF1697 domain-containing protein [Methylovulum miyakonense]
MKTYIALFRGINVGGNNSLPMKGLVAILENIGLINVKAYIQSGNVVFQGKAENTLQLANKISAEINTSRGFSPQVLLLEPQELEQALKSNPFPEAEAEPNTLHLFFLSAAPETPGLETLANIKQETERFRLIGKVFYLHAPKGIGRSKLAAQAEKLLGVSATSRNWRTVCTLMAMATA